jgi:hypothetical protein
MDVFIRAKRAIADQFLMRFASFALTHYVEQVSLE